jgi:SAM-dependent methyltransferase
MSTYQFCANWIASQLPHQGMRVLDYGCGAGQIVKLLRSRGIEAYGCDVFYEGGDSSSNIDTSIVPFIHRMDGDRIPFEAGSFDVVLSNQVLEHVPNLDGVVAELARVLKSGGIAINLFPDMGVWREGHCGVPLLHRFPKGSTLRIYYAALFRALGFGQFTQGKSIMKWSLDFCEWLDKWTYYRPQSEIHGVFGRHFTSTSHHEERWFNARFNGRLRYLPVASQRMIVRKFAGLALLSVKG